MSAMPSTEQTYTEEQVQALCRQAEIRGRRDMRIEIATDLQMAAETEVSVLKAKWYRAVASRLIPPTTTDRR